MIPRPYQLLMLAAWITGLSGCTVWQNARRTLRHEPHEFSWEHDRGTSRKLYLSWADASWQEARKHCTAETQLTPDYEWGFQEGFADYCYAGGTGEPPGAPPRPYWHAFKRMSPERQKVDQWFAGYRHGAKVARTGGYREQAILRSPGNASAALKPTAAVTTTVENFAQVAAPINSAPMLKAPEQVSAPAADSAKAKPADRTPAPKLELPKSLPAPENPPKLKGGETPTAATAQPVFTPDWFPIEMATERTTPPAIPVVPAPASPVPTTPVTTSPVSPTAISPGLATPSTHAPGTALPPHSQLNPSIAKPGPATSAATKSAVPSSRSPHSIRIQPASQDSAAQNLPPAAPLKPLREVSGPPLALPPVKIIEAAPAAYESAEPVPSQGWFER